MLFEYLNNASVLNLNWLVVVNRFNDTFLDALEFSAGDFLVFRKFFNEFGPPNEVCRIFVFLGHFQDLLLSKNAIFPDF